MTLQDPIRYARRRSLITWLIAGPVIVAIAAWSLLPTQRPDLGQLDLDMDPIARDDAEPIQPLDLAAFDAPIWQLPEQERLKTLADTQARPTVRFPDVDLIAIVRDGDQFRAAVYLRSIDELVIAGSNEQIGEGLSVVDVTTDGVELGFAGKTRWFELKKPEIIKLGTAG